MSSGTPPSADPLERMRSIGPWAVGLVAVFVFALGAMAASVTDLISRERLCELDQSPPLLLSGCDLRAKKFADLDLVGADLRSVRLDGADLSGRDLRGADLSAASLAGATLVKTNLAGADLDGANVRGATFDGACLRGADLRRVNLETASWVGADLSGAVTDQSPSPAPTEPTREQQASGSPCNP